MSIQATSRQALRQQILDKLATAHWLPGHRLPSERHLAEDFGVSRSSVNELLTELALEGFIERQPGKRARVVNLFRDEFQALVDSMPGASRDLSFIYELRAQLEAQAAYYCAQRATPEQLQLISEEYDAMVRRNQGETTLSKAKADLRFHTLIAECSHNLPVVSFSLLFYERFFNTIYIALDLTLKRFGRYPEGIRGQHQAIFQAIQRRDAEAAKAAALSHVRYTGERYLEASAWVSKRN